MKQAVLSSTKPLTQVSDEDLSNRIVERMGRLFPGLSPDFPTSDYGSNLPLADKLQKKQRIKVDGAHNSKMRDLMTDLYIVVPTVQPWKDDPEIISVLDQYNRVKNKNKGKRKRELSEEKANPTPKRRKLQETNNPPTKTPAASPPSRPVAKHSPQVIQETILKNGEYYDRKCYEIKQLGTQLKRDTTEKAKTEEEKGKGYLKAGLKYMESIHASQCALNAYMDESNSHKVTSTRKSIITMCCEVAKYFAGCRNLVRTTRYVGMYYLCQSVLCYRAVNLSNIKPMHCGIKAGVTLNDEQEEYLASIQTLLAGNVAWEKGQLKGAPMSINPHTEDSVSELIQVVKDSLTKT